MSGRKRLQDWAVRRSEAALALEKWCQKLAAICKRMEAHDGRLAEVETSAEKGDDACGACFAFVGAARSAQLRNLRTDRMLVLRRLKDSVASLSEKMQRQSGLNKSAETTVGQVLDLYDLGEAVHLASDTLKSEVTIAVEGASLEARETAWQTAEDLGAEIEGCQRVVITQILEPPQSVPSNTQAILNETLEHMRSEAPRIEAAFAGCFAALAGRQTLATAAELQQEARSIAETLQETRVHMPAEHISMPDDASLRTAQRCVDKFVVDLQKLAEQLPQDVQRFRSSADMLTFASTESFVTSNPAEYVTWRPICRGEAIPIGAVISGCTKTDGDTYVAKNVAHEPGKLNTDKGRMWNLWCHRGISGQKDAQNGFILTLSPEVTEQWMPLRSGDPIPANAVKAGKHSRDGDVYIGRETNSGACGKITQDRGRMRKLWVHGSRFLGAGHHNGDILVVQGPQ
eukprot:TRINITY_DN10367_c0_g1_i3.p1 TRINITY_DN10367_c0_g1~~TRINITY_DN10367_c0_g1_i3.p1  ORF type:complete len:458 (-),score=32.63 TRINITY_DN10367_c0_g1_i3:120-1493(-)